MRTVTPRSESRPQSGNAHLPERERARLLLDRTTGIPNYYALPAAFSKRKRQGRPFAVLLLDIKGFGRFNERRRGHLRGNELLHSFAASVRRATRPTDLLVRWSVGDEFVLLAEVVSHAEIAALCARLAGPHSVKWGRRTRLLSCYVVGAPVGHQRLGEVENSLHERLRRLKIATKLADRS